jgi:ferrous iron transport protein B
MGFDWKTNISLIAGLAAKELVVSTLATAHSMTVTDEETTSLSVKLANDPNWSPLKALSLIVFILLYMPCVATVAVIKKETNSWKWATFSIVYTTLIAILFASIVYHVGQLF